MSTRRLRHPTLLLPDSISAGGIRFGPLVLGKGSVVDILRSDAEDRKVAYVDVIGRRLTGTIARQTRTKATTSPLLYRPCNPALKLQAWDIRRERAWMKAGSRSTSKEQTMNVSTQKSPSKKPSAAAAEDKITITKADIRKAQKGAPKAKAVKPKKSATGAEPRTGVSAPATTLYERLHDAKAKPALCGIAKKLMTGASVNKKTLLELRDGINEHLVTLREAKKGKQVTALKRSIRYVRHLINS